VERREPAKKEHSDSDENGEYFCSVGKRRRSTAEERARASRVQELT
jgi:hypothetical protein